jgi:hypothetical protein
MLKRKNKVRLQKAVIFFTTLGLIVSPIGDLLDIGKNFVTKPDTALEWNAGAPNTNQYNFSGSQQVIIANQSSPEGKQQIRMSTDNVSASPGVDIAKPKVSIRNKHKVVVDTLAKMNEKIVFLLNKLRLATADSVIADVMEELYVFATMEGKYCHIVDSICQYLDEHPALQLDVSRLNTELGRIVTMSKAGDWANRTAYVQMIKQRVESRKIDG